MVQDNAQIRRQGAHDFMAYYEFACARQDSVPLSAVKMNLEKGLLDFNGDRIKINDWPPILHSISINKHLHHIAISSTYRASLASGDADKTYPKAAFRRRVPAICSKDMTLKLCKALRECLTVSPNLKTLQLKGLLLRERDLITLTKGLAKSTSLENLSMANCPISDQGLEIICQSVKYSSSLRTIDFTGCSLTWRGAEHLTNIIKYQGMQRHGTAWAESLRYRHPQFEGMRGLRRVTLNCNTLIGDRGVAALAHELAEDLWIKAVDLQRCGLSNEGARRLLEALKTNSSLRVLDIRSNPLVEKVLIKTVIEKVLMNADGQPTEYCWIKPETTEPQRVPGPKKRALHSTVRGKTTLKKGVATYKGASPGGWSSLVVQTNKSSSCNVPWRAAARAERQRGLPPGVMVTGPSLQVTVESDSEGEEDYDDEEEEVVDVDQRPSSVCLQETITARQYERIQMELKECRLRLAEERRARLKAESRLMEYELENARLRDAKQSLSEALAASGSAAAGPAFSPLEDDAVLESIENSFTKFHAFLDLLNDAGLGQLASMAGIDKSDLQPLGRPQLSSTIGPHPDGAASLTAREFRDVPDRNNTMSVAATVAPVVSDKVADTTTHRFPSPVRAYCGLTHAAEPVVSQYLQPDREHESSTEYSHCSRKSSAGISVGKTCQTQWSPPRTGTVSQSSNSSHRYSSNNSCVNSHTSKCNASYVSSSDSVGEIIKEKTESAGSVRSRNGENGRMVIIGHLGSEKTAYPGRGTLDQIGSVGDQSDVDSF
ncbi:centrosomal protein of 78 kDa isoform X2 [Cololabis saira]|uniref:centrosomal protein of 78 kDa isoform X2 n=1 Tax=Cololabis saira TaxID=129043 RepID=UPI002AD1F641|nr:centrosomal protein of 78 kDa isoform X2 [Cololabis saira]